MPTSRLILWVRALSWACPSDPAASIVRTGPKHDTLTIHATTVALKGCAVLIRGASGRGKSRLALEMIGQGALLVSDDRTVLWRAGDALMSDAPDAIRGQIEARGVGLLNAPHAGPCRVVLVADLDRIETERLPQPCVTEILGVELPVQGFSEMTCFSAALLLYLGHGRYA